MQSEVPPWANPQEWLDRARGNLRLAEAFDALEGVLYEDYCFEEQQAAEKSIKAVLIHLKVSFPKTHSIEDLLTLVRNEQLSIPDNVLKAAILTPYAVETRYPNMSEPVKRQECATAVQAAQVVFQWAEQAVRLG
jgi:HEPN domain-containing protein